MSQSPAEVKQGNVPPYFSCHTVNMHHLCGLLRTVSSHFCDFFFSKLMSEMASNVVLRCWVGFLNAEGRNVPSKNRCVEDKRLSMRCSAAGCEFKINRPKMYK